MKCSEARVEREDPDPGRSHANVEHTLLEMKVGGYRKVRISPHLAYSGKGIPDLIPPDAMLVAGGCWKRVQCGLNEPADAFPLPFQP